MVIKRLAVSSAFDRRRQLLVDRCDRLVERVDLTHERTKRGAHAVGDHDLAVVGEAVGGQALEAIGVLRALRRDDADLGHVPAQGVEKRRALAGQKLARPVAHQLGRARKPKGRQRRTAAYPRQGWTSQPQRFTISPLSKMPGLNIWHRRSTGRASEFSLRRRSGQQAGRRLTHFAMALRRLLTPDAHLSLLLALSVAEGDDLQGNWERRRKPHLHG
jgi:hypothetical protein